MKLFLKKLECLLNSHVITSEQLEAFAPLGSESGNSEIICNRCENKFVPEDEKSYQFISH